MIALRIGSPTRFARCPGAPSRFALCLLLAVVLGCSGGRAIPTGPPPAPTPLTVEEWKALDVSLKYDPSTYERLQLGDPKLKQQSAWKKFETDVIGPEFKKDHPSL